MSDRDLQQEFYQERVGREILKCIQCGTCSASCPLTNSMDHAPRELFELIRNGEMAEALESDTPWYCVSCYYCMARCPKEIPVTDIMYVLKQKAIESGLEPRDQKMPDLYRSFRRVLKRNGRVTEGMIMADYGLRHPGDTIGKIPLGLKLLKKRRVEIFPTRIKKRGPIL
ncbi:MAG: 4Fe-4S dicluster domain-containing protein [Proteobacteria bacterium]|nr:4Fe-4S dicluster domain-containing protein [Pseudomonadota bacterium]